MAEGMMALTAAAQGFHLAMMAVMVVVTPSLVVVVVVMAATVPLRKRCRGDMIKRNPCSSNLQSRWNLSRNRPNGIPNKNTPGVVVMMTFRMITGTMQTITRGLHSVMMAMTVATRSLAVAVLVSVLVLVLVLVLDKQPLVVLLSI